MPRARGPPSGVIAHSVPPVPSIHTPPSTTSTILWNRLAMPFPVYSRGNTGGVDADFAAVKPPAASRRFLVLVLERLDSGDACRFCHRCESVDILLPDLA